MCLIRIKDQPDDRPKIGLRRTQRQEDAITALRAFIYRTDPRNHKEVDNVYDRALDEHLHELLEALFYQELQHTDFIACPTDVTLILLALRQDGSFASGSIITHYCSTQQYMMKATPTHSLRLHASGEARYIPFPTNAGGSDDEIITENDDSFIT